ncbi:BQ5605_C007g04394 [Microbotryum silenes-dioicae]|uniref:BQ5605_C007g04394 protein n=1 Tax=Microbotryum silenes-dioicae TaxID=796604 RepID=A0A2X0MB09_9BASI|nr:BQ5605_C007g04394 [Microbotryum silenes-dioicae]
MYLDDPDIELLDDNLERMAPFLNVRVSRASRLPLRQPIADTQIQLSWSTDEPLEFDTLPRPLAAWTDKFKDRGAITAARKQGYRSIAIAGHRLPFGVERIWRHIDYAERMRSIVISSQNAFLHTRLDFVVEHAVRSLAALGLNNDTAPLAVQQAYDEADAQAEERFLLDVIVTANESLPGRAQILRLPSLLRHDTRQLALDPKSLIEHRRAHQCAHLKAVLLKGRHGAPTSTAQDFDPTSKAKLSKHGEMYSSVLRGLVHSMGAARLEAVSGVARSIRWTGQTAFSRFSTANETENIGYIEDRRKDVSCNCALHIWPRECSSIISILAQIRMQLRARQYTAFANARSIRWTGQGTFSRFSTANETENIEYIEDRRKDVSCNCALHIWPRECSSIISILAQIRMQLRARQYTAFAKIPPFGSIDGNVTSATPLKIGSLVCFVLKRGIIPASCASNIGEEQLSIGLGSYTSR